MPEQPFISTETLKLADLNTADVFYTPLDARFDRLTRLAREALDVSVAGIALARDDTFWFKSIAGWDVQELPRQRSLCCLTLDRNLVVVIEDTAADPATREHPLVVDSPKFRFYAGYPLTGNSMGPIGTLCAYDVKPRKLRASQLQALRDLGELAQRELLTARLAEGQRQLIAKLDLARQQAMIDPLTRVWNRRAGLELLEKTCQQASKKRFEFAVCMADLNKFKAINDERGHQTGDEVLKKVARIIVSSLRDQDTVARYGGDEFIVIIERITRDELARLTKRICEHVGEFPLKTRTGDISVGITIGSAFCSVGRSIAAEELIEQADQVLMSSKRQRSVA